jgi:Ca2+-transporting ATPase
MLILKPYAQSVDDLVKKLETDIEKGLTFEQVDEKFDKYGPNELPTAQGINHLSLLLDQFKDLLVLILIAAGIISGLIGYLKNDPESFIDVIAIAIVVGLNAFLGFYQELSAEKAINSLKKLTLAEVIVIRKGEKTKIPSQKLVPGDIIILEAGETVPADIRLIQGYELRCIESTLTGESLPVKKRNIIFSEKVPLGDRINMLFKGTSIVNGTGKGLVVFTGEDTEIGKIATSLIEIKTDETPLQKRLAELAKQITLGVVALSAIVLIIGFLFLPSLEITELFIFAIGLAVAAIPEGLPAVLTLSLAIGVTRLAKKNSLIRKLPAVEVLGSTTVICSDKTGTLTKNEMTVQILMTQDHIFNVSGNGYLNNGEILDAMSGVKASPDSKNYYDLKLALEICSLANDATIMYVSPQSPFKVFGDPTEVALLVVTAKAGRVGTEYLDNNIKKEWSREFVFPFDSDRKMMSAIVKNNSNNSYRILVKGATDVLLEKCSTVIRNNQISQMTDDKRKSISLSSDSYSETFAYRILGLSYKDISKEEAEELIKNENHLEAEKDLTFLGFIGMIDPPREQSQPAIERAHKAGINVIMITGDHSKTAIAIGKSIGLIQKGHDDAITGLQLDELSDAELTDKLETTNIFARVSPAHKLRIVNLLKDKKEIVAMTGDGVNDAPALKRADIGIAMGITGTDVAKEASEMILVDDNFANIVEAVNEGRVIYDNMKKFIAFLLSANAGEILTVIFGILLGIYFGQPLIPVLAIQLLYINLVTDTFPAIALGIDNPEEDVMNRNPRDPDEPLLDRNLLSMIIVSGIVFALGSLFTFLLTIDFGNAITEENIKIGQTMVFTSLVIYQLFHAINASERRTIFKIQTFKNSALFVALAVGFLLQFIALYMPLVAELLNTVPLSLEQWIIILISAIPVVLVEEIRKIVYFNKYEDSENTNLENKYN